MVSFQHAELFSTYSIVARDGETGQLGGAVQTHQVGVGRIIPMALPGLGVVNSQSLANVSLAPIALAMMREGVDPQQIMAGLVASDPGAPRRQVGMVDAQGRVAAFTGEGCIPSAAHHMGEGYAVMANMMTRDTVIAAMCAAYESATGDLAARMLAALQAAQAEDGDIRGMESAALKVVSGDATAPAWSSVYDLRVDKSDDPVGALADLVRIRHASHLDDEGHRLMASGEFGPGLDRWRLAREAAPETEELGFWQAVYLADHLPFADAMDLAVRIMRESVGEDDRYLHWLDLAGRLQAVGLISRPGAADELLAALNRQID
jgi:uncharacterized Ntn-hydrolase superfamily protein